MTLRGLLLISFLMILLSSCSKDSSSGPSDMGSPIGSATGSNSSSGDLTAGEWNDIDHWQFWMNLLDSEGNAYVSRWGYHTSPRLELTLDDAAGKAVAGATVEASDSQGNILWQAQTDNFGKAEIFSSLLAAAKATALHLKAGYEGVTYDLGTVKPDSVRLTKQIPVQRTPYANCDIMFAVDATGSMGDEIQYLKKDLGNVLNRIKNQVPGISLRTGAVFYRDHSDEYLTRISGFTTDIKSLTDFINKQSAAGGGDIPEAVEEGLDAAINKQEWSDKALCRIIFLILDAPPHDNAISRMHDLEIQAAKKGIKIIPVTASGADKATEFLLRFMAIGTNGTYTFLTNDSGIGNDHIKASVGPYNVEYLSDLLVRLVTKYCQN